MYSEMESAMSMEARMETLELNQHQHRLAMFGMSFRGEPVDSVGVEAAPEPPPEGRVHRMLRLLSFSFLLKAGAIMSSVILTLSPLRAVWKMQETKSTLNYPPYTFFCVAACGLQWCAYGSFAFIVTNNYGFLILVYSNVLGVIMGTYYCYTYYSNIRDEHRRGQLMTCLYAAAANFAFEGIVIPTLPHPRALLIVGTLSAFYSVLVSFAPVADVNRILGKGDISGMPKDVVLASFVASILWFGCALLLHDTWILVPNFFGLVLGGIQIFILAYFGGFGPMPFHSPFAAKGAKGSYGTMAQKLVQEDAPEPAPIYCGSGGTGET